MRLADLGPAWHAVLTTHLLRGSLSTPAPPSAAQALTGRTTHDPAPRQSCSGSESLSTDLVTEPFCS